MENIHGGDIYSYENVVDFSANINPLKTPENILTAVRESLCQMHHYPDMFCRELRQAIGKQEDIEPEAVICGNGAADLIYRLMYAVKPKKALVLAPGFAEYEQALKAVGSQVEYYYLNHDTFALEENFVEVLTKELDMVCLCNPNNPTGKVIEKSLMLHISQVCKDKGIFLLIDECFNDFLDSPQKYTMMEQAKKDSHIFILKAFTKMYGMAGIRLGYGICRDSRLLERMYQCGSPWNVSSPAQAAGVAALKEKEFVEITRAYIKKEKKFLYESLGQMGIQYWNSGANYIFFQAKEGLKEALLAKGILIRDCSNYQGLTKGYYRIAIKSAKENQMLIEALREVIC